MPIMVAAVYWSYRGHRQLLPLALAIIALLIAYAHVFGDTPEWTQWFAVGLGVGVAFLDWRATTQWGRACAVQIPAQAGDEDPGAPVITRKAAGG
jgi:hypothetical protein